MTTGVSRLSGNDWQAFADQLLSRRYGPAQYQKIPSKDAGDAGIEGFTLSGHAYQAYGVEEPVTTQKRYEKQRDKMTKDLAKFQDNQAKLKALLGSVILSRWCLLVPTFDSKDLVEHAARKTEEVLAAKLPYTSSDFRVMICDEQEFAVERDVLLNAGINKLTITPTEATKEEIAEWADENDDLVRVLDGKLARLKTLKNKRARKAFRDRIIKHYREGQDIIETLRKYPQTHERVLKAKSNRESFLATECMVSTGTPGNILQEALKEIETSVTKEAVGVGAFTAKALAWEAVADWMLRCPLDFPEETP